MRRVFGFGDSILKGVVLSDGPAMRYERLPEGFLERGLRPRGFDVYNHARFGSTIRTGMEVFGRHLHSVTSGDVVVLEFGGNDCDFPWSAIGENPDYPKTPFTSLPEFSRIYKCIIGDCRERGALPVILSLPPLVPQRFYDFVTRDLPAEGKANVLRWMCGNTDFVGNWHEQFNLEVFRLAREMDVPLIDITTPLLVRQDYFSFICRDGIHPNDEGHSLMADALRKQWSGQPGAVL